MTFQELVTEVSKVNLEASEKLLAYEEAHKNGSISENINWVSSGVDNTLANMFIWEDSNEGHKYWSDVRNQLRSNW